MLHVSFAMTTEAYSNCSKTETRRLWKPSHAKKFRPGRVFMGLSKDFRAGGERMHPSRVVFCREETLADMTEESFWREGGTYYWSSREKYIEMMGGPEKSLYVIRFEHVNEDENGEFVADPPVRDAVIQRSDGIWYLRTYVDLCKEKEKFEITCVSHASAASEFFAYRHLQAKAVQDGWQLGRVFYSDKEAEKVWIKEVQGGRDGHDWFRC